MPDSPSAFFTVSYDRLTEVITAVVCAMLLLLAVLLRQPLIAVPAILVIGLAYAYSPRGYAVSTREIVVKRLVGAVRIPLGDVREARRVTGSDLQGCIRLWGSGGMFGYYGLFRTSRFGKCWWYVTNRRNSLVVITGEKTALFSPDDVEGFLAAVRVTAPAGSLPGTPPPPSRASRVGVAVAIAAGLLVAAVVPLAFLYSPGPPQYTLTRGSLAIRDRFYPVTVQAASVDAGGIRVIDFAADREWRPTLRTNGFANSHYQSGWFRVANGKKVRMYRAGGKRLVLLPPKGGEAAVLLQVENPDRFVDEIRRLW